MKKLLLLVVIGLSFTGLTFAHPGNVDVYWWHTCYTNCYLYWLYDWEYHFDIQTTTMPMSYIQYAPNWSCETERLAYQTNEQAIKDLQTMIDKTYNDLVAQYPLEITQILMVKASKINVDLIKEQSIKSSNSNLLMTEYYACRSNAWYEIYKQQKTNESIINTSITTNTNTNTTANTNSLYTNTTTETIELSNAISRMYDN